MNWWFELKVDSLGLGGVEPFPGGFGNEDWWLRTEHRHLLLHFSFLILFTNLHIVHQLLGLIVSTVVDIFFSNTNVTLPPLNRRTRVSRAGVNSLRSDQELLLDISAIWAVNVLLLLLVRHFFIFEGLEDLFAAEGGHDHAEGGAVLVVDFALLGQVREEPLDLRLGVLVDARGARLLKRQDLGLLNLPVATLFRNLGLALLWSHFESYMVLPV